MDDVRKIVGGKIKFYRKLRGISLTELAASISKSKSTLSKYESGDIEIDISTLFEIASALDIKPTLLIDVFTEKASSKARSVNEFFDTSRLYICYYNGRNNNFLKGIMHLDFSGSDLDDGDINVHFYLGVEDYNKPEKCQHFYCGTMQSYSMFTHFNLYNNINPAEKMQITFANPFEQGTKIIGMMTAFSMNPFGNIAIKVLCSSAPLYENDENLEIVRLNKEEINSIKKKNVVLILPY